MNETNPHALILPTPPPPAATATNAAEEALRDVKSIVEIPSDWTWLWWTLGLLAMAGILTAVAWWIYRRRQEATYVIPELPYERARKRLEQALARLINEPKPFCIEVSDTLRVYLEEQFKLRAPERTTEEFLIELQTSNVLNEAQKRSLDHFLGRCDLVKFAKLEPTQVELRDLYEAAVRLVEETIPVPIMDVAGVSTDEPQPKPQAAA
jgi:hypothetical protein